VAEMGRPQIEINWKALDLLCAAQCTLEEIAARLEVSEDTIQRAVKRAHNQTFAAYFGQKRKVGHASLRARQYQTAMEGNVTMQIWLGKQWLGQKDVVETTGRNTEMMDALIRAIQASGHMHGPSASAEDTTSPKADEAPQTDAI